MLEVQTREQELQHNNQLKEQWIPRKWELLCANLRKEKKSQLLNLLQRSNWVTFWYTSVASDSEYNQAWVKKLYLDKGFRWIIASFKRLRDVQYVTDETVKKLISVICAMRSVMWKYTTKFIPTTHSPTANNKGAGSNSAKHHDSSKEPQQLELNFEDYPAESWNGNGTNKNEGDRNKYREEIDEIYDDRDTEYEHRWQIYNNK